MMQQTELSNKPCGGGARLPAIPLGASSAGMILAIVVGLVTLAAGAYLVPSLTAYGLVFLGLGIPVLLLFWGHPEFGLLTIIFLISSLIPGDLVDVRLPIGGGLNLRDLILIGMLGLLILRGLIHKSLPIPWWPVSAPLLIFLGLAFFSALYALTYRNVESNWALSDLRAMSFFCVFFVTAWSITNRRQLTTVLVGLFIFADLITAALILQQSLGANNALLAAMSYTNWQMYAQEQTGMSQGFGMVRIMPPAVLLVYFMMIMSFCLMAFTQHNRRLRTIFFLQFLYLNIGLLLTYTRAAWVASAAALGLSLVALFPTYKAYLIRYILMGIPVLALLIGLLGTNLTDSLRNSELVTMSIERILSIFTPEETLDSYSLQWRVYETAEGLRSVSEHPLVGVGLGSTYREVTTLQGEALGWATKGSLAAGIISRYTRFLHNSYLSIAVKMGLPALACFLWFCVALVINSGRLYANLLQRQHRAIVLAVLTGFVGVMLWSILHQHFVATESTAIVGLMAGLAAGLRHDFVIQSGLRQPLYRASMRPNL